MSGRHKWSQIKRKRGEKVSEENEAQNDSSGSVEEQIAAAHGGELPGPDEMTAEEAAALAQDMQQVHLPVMHIPLANCAIRIVPNEEGGKNMFVGPIAITFVLPFSEEGVRNITRDLTGGIEIASSLPPDLKVVQ